MEFHYYSGWVGGGVGPKKNEINAILNSVGVKVEVGVELGNNQHELYSNNLEIHNNFCHTWLYQGFSGKYQLARCVKIS